MARACRCLTTRDTNPTSTRSNSRSPCSRLTHAGGRHRNLTANPDESRLAARRATGTIARRSSSAAPRDSSPPVFLGLLALYGQDLVGELDADILSVDARELDDDLKPIGLLDQVHRPRYRPGRAAERGLVAAENEGEEGSRKSKG